MWDPNARVPTYEEAMKCSSAPPNHYPNSSVQPNILVMPQSMMDVTPNMNIIPQPIITAPSIPNQQMPSFVQSITVNSIRCQLCDMPMQTRIGHATTCCTHLACLLLCGMGCICCAPCVYCTSTCREPRLYCINCGARA